jgi:hypothetical protein
MIVSKATKYQWAETEPMTLKDFVLGITLALLSVVWGTSGIWLLQGLMGMGAAAMIFGRGTYAVIDLMIAGALFFIVTAALFAWGAIAAFRGAIREP